MFEPQSDEVVQEEKAENILHRKPVLRSSSFVRSDEF